MPREKLFPQNTPLGTIEYMRPTIPRGPELVDFWSDRLEYWAQTGGMDQVGQEELEQAHQAAHSLAEEILTESAPRDLPLAAAWSNMSLHAAQLIREQAFSATLEELDE